MGQEHHIDPSKLEEKFEFTSKKKTQVFTILGIGIVMFVLGILVESTGFSLLGHEDHAHKEELKAVDTNVPEVVLLHEKREITSAPPGNHELHSDEKHIENKEHAEDEELESAHGHGEHHGPTWLNRLFANIWLNNIFFTGLGIIALFFLAFNYVSYAGWYSSIKRIPEAMVPILYVTLPLILITFFVGKGYLFHWAHDGVMDPESPNYDSIIASKEWWLNLPFYVGRTVVFGGLWILIYQVLRRFSLREDTEGGTKLYNKTIWWSALFLVIFGVSSSILAWDWVMSIDTHWFSTLFGWYMFASWFVSGLATITLIVIFLKEEGYLEVVTENHLHDLGKFMFAFSIFWTYLFFAQFLLYYYSNIPEEVFYYRQRMWSWDMKYFGTFFLTFFINFVFPFLILMTRGSKRRPLILKVVAFAILIGHYLDFYMMIMPGTNLDQTGFGFLEFGTLLIYISIFMMVVNTYLAKANLIAKNHPMLEESLNHHI